MKNLGTISFIALILFLTSACSTNECGSNKAKFLANFNDLIEEVTEAELDYSDDAWDKHDNRFRKFVEDCYPEYEEELSNRERRKFWGQFVKYYYKRYGAGLAQEMLAQGGAQLEGVQLQLDNLPIKELEGLMETIGGDMERWGEELENWADRLFDSFE